MVKIILLLIILILFLIYIYYISKNNKEHFTSNENNLENKLIIVTGSTRGIGYELAKKLNKMGAKVVIHGRKQETVDKILRDFEKTNPYVAGYAADLTDEKQVETFVKKVTNKNPKIYALINNAVSITGNRRLSEKSHLDFKKDLDVNVNSLMLITNKVISQMKNNYSKGRIINVSSYHSKLNNSNFNNGTLMFNKNIIEKFSKILVEETSRHDISVCTLRIDENILTNKLFGEEIPYIGKSVRKKIDSVIDLMISKPKKILPIFVYALQAPAHEINGKVISTNAFKYNSNLSKIIPAHQLTLKSLYEKIELTKEKKDSIHLVKQNPFGMSPTLKKFLKNYNYDNQKINILKDGTKLDKLLAKDLNILSKQITFFKTDYDAIRKVLDIFVPKNNEVLTAYPTDIELSIICKEKKIDLLYSRYKKENNYIEIDYNDVFNHSKHNTKLIYLSSPNLFSGQSMNKKNFDTFIKKMPDNIIVFIDQRFIDFSDNKEAFNPLEYLDKNIIILRSFNNFYGYENLQLCYLICNEELSEFIKQSNIFNGPNNFDEQLAYIAYKDKKYNKLVKKMITKERKRIFKKLDNLDISYLPSEVNYFLLNNNNNYDTNVKLLEENNIILYKSDDTFGEYLTIPISEPEVNNKVIDILSNE